MTKQSASEWPLMSLLKTQTCGSTNLYDSPSWSSIPSPSFHALNPPGTGSAQIERIPSPIPSPMVSRLSTAAHRSNLNPYRFDNPPNPKFNAPHSSHTRSYESRSSISLESISSDGAFIPARLNDALGKELTQNMLHTNGNFLEKLFPPERLPFPVNEELLKKLSMAMGANAPIWNGLKKCFHRPPMIAFGEAAVCEWLNNIGIAMGFVYGLQHERLWWSGHCKVPLVASSIQQKPDLVLLDRVYYDKLSQKNFADTGWAFIKAVAEVHQPNARLTETSTTRSYLTFLCQPHRRFTISLSFFNPKKTQFSVTVTDRVGQLCIAKMDLMESSVDNGLLLLSILAFLMFGRPEDIGLDPHFKIDPLDGHIVAVECENRRFEVLKRIHALPSLFGRGTQVWIVARNGVKYIMKDSWVREGRNNEVRHLRKMIPHEELKGRVPTLICGGDVVIDGFKDSTRRYQSTHRIHRRIVTSPVGESITSFKTKKEFIRALINVIETHRYLHNHVGILHCDLSLGNILLHRQDNESEAIGLLVDYDYSLDTEAVNLKHAMSRCCEPDASDIRVAGDAGHVAAGSPVPAIGSESRPTSRTGTPPFMAIEALLATNPTFVHKPQHDLESILYIILYMCTFIHSPGLPPSRHDSPPIRTWFCNADIREIGYRKLGHLENYEAQILPHFTPYWCDFAPFVKDLIIACFPVKAHLPNDFQYDQVLQVLKMACDSVEEPQIALPSRAKRASTSFYPDSKKGKRA